MADLLQVVDAISASPTVLINLADKAALSFKNFVANPPQLRRTTSSSSLGDGDLLMAASYADREIEFDLNILTTTNDLNSTQLQNLARILGNGDAWIKFQKNGSTNPVFFRTKRADITSLQEFWNIPGTRVVHLSIPCDPFTYGLPETGSFTITNDPTTGTNKMLASMPTIKGDVSTPLHLTFPTVQAAHRIHVASRAALDGTVLSAPYYKSLSAATKDATPTTGWTITDTADTDMVSGTRRRLTYNAVGGTPFMVPTSATVLTWDSLPPGDYRAFARLGHNGVDDVTLHFFNRPPRNGTAYTVEEAAATATYSPGVDGKDWVDFGVVAMPGDGPQTDASFDLAGATGTSVWNIGVSSEITLVAVDLDAVVLVPAGRPETVTRHGSASFPAPFTNKAVTLDGVNNRWFAAGEPTSASGTTTMVAPDDIAGSLPIVVPNATNVIHFFANITIADVARALDVKTTTTAITWKYFPRYVYDRPAST
jgi:hypothetical protein